MISYIWIYLYQGSVFTWTGNEEHNIGNIRTWKGTRVEICSCNILPSVCNTKQCAVVLVEHTAQVFCFINN